MAKRFFGGSGQCNSNLFWKDVLVQIWMRSCLCLLQGSGQAVHHIEWMHVSRVPDFSLGLSQFPAEVFVSVGLSCSELSPDSWWRETHHLHEVHSSGWWVTFVFTKGKNERRKQEGMQLALRWQW